VFYFRLGLPNFVDERYITKLMLRDTDTKTFIKSARRRIKRFVGTERRTFGFRNTTSAWRCSVELIGDTAECNGCCVSRLAYLPVYTQLAS
jgi:hypothetical protein